MMNIKNTQRTVKLTIIRKTLSAAILSMMALGASAQDLIARQAPMDRAMNDVHNVKLSAAHSATSAASANLNNPAADIYTNWNNKGVKNADGFAPANMKIDLRGFVMPTPSRQVNSPFGHRWGRLHAGLDVKVYIGDTIVAAFDGKVRIVDFNANGYGNYVVIRHPNGLETLYGHMSKHLVKENQIVHAGEPIGLGGNTGRSYGSHLHFETRICGTPVDPALMFDFPHQDVKSDFFVTTTSYGTRSSAVAATTSRIATENERAAYAAVAAEEAAAKNEAAAATGKAAPAVAAVTAKTAKSNKTSKKQPKAQQKSYTVKSGDSLTAIARRNGTTVDALCKKNGLSRNTTIRPGQTLKY